MRKDNEAFVKWKSDQMTAGKSHPVRKQMRRIAVPFSLTATSSEN
jgi:hypothetical protein